MQVPLTLVISIQLSLSLLHLSPHLTSSLSPCRTLCGNIAVNYPFGLDDGCGAPQFHNMLNCSDQLFFQTPSGNYKVQSIDYNKKTMVIYDPAMTTCSILQPHHDFVMTDIQSVIIPPSPDTVFVLLNCSIDSPVLNHYKSLCFNFSGHSCDEMYGPCNALKLFRLFYNVSPPCCFTDYDTVKYMSMNILDCSHYTTLYNVDNLKGVGPSDWPYGIRLSYAVPDTGCDRCTHSGGTCGYDVETGGTLCICSTSVNSTRECAAGSIVDDGWRWTSSKWNQVVVLSFGAFLSMKLLSNLDSLGCRVVGRVGQAKAILFLATELEMELV
ncbi:Wall-associated receptor kinase, galacturonan-binding domain [Dillenia turbinata]|uniref:non-specific serine/threonine protein kinase n=1 Tax=Dillenia turbinata TaxID=194707 RepID=A0AAN8Z885_9MAGN